MHLSHHAKLCDFFPSQVIRKKSQTSNLLAVAKFTVLKIRFSRCLLFHYYKF